MKTTTPPPAWALTTEPHPTDSTKVLAPFDLAAAKAGVPIAWFYEGAPMIFHGVSTKGKPICEPTNTGIAYSYDEEKLRLLLPAPPEGWALVADTKDVIASDILHAEYGEFRIYRRKLTTMEEPLTDHTDTGPACSIAQGGPQSAPTAPTVAGRRIRGSNNEFEHACLVHIERLQHSLGDYDSAMLDTFCEAVRLVREYSDAMAIPNEVDVLRARIIALESGERYLAHCRELIGAIDDETLGDAIQRVLRERDGLKSAIKWVCQPTAASWIPWHGGECPVPDETLVEVRLKDSSYEAAAAASFQWQHKVGYENIIAYRVIESAPAATQTATPQGKSPAIDKPVAAAGAPSAAIETLLTGLGPRPLTLADVREEIARALRMLAVRSTDGFVANWLQVVAHQLREQASK